MGKSFSEKVIRKSWAVIIWTDEDRASTRTGNPPATRKARAAAIGLGVKIGDDDDTVCVLGSEVFAVRFATKPEAEAYKSQHHPDEETVIVQTDRKPSRHQDFNLSDAMVGIMPKYPPRYDSQPIAIS